MSATASKVLEDRKGEAGMPDRTLHIPIDIEVRTEFRILESRIGREKALAAVLILFRDLGYAAAQDSVGFILGPRTRPLEDSLEGICGLLDLTVDGCFLVKAESGFSCPIFAAENKHLSKDFKSIQEKGGAARAFKLRERQAEMDAPKLNAMLQPGLFIVEGVGESGEKTAMAPDERNRCLTLIRLFDNVTGRRDRLNGEYSAGLIGTAYEVIKRFDREAINRAAQLVMQTHERGHQLNTETVLKDFHQYAQREAAPMAA